jgi:hypothetical protein
MGTASADSTLLASARIPLSSPGVNVLPTEAAPVGCGERASNQPALAQFDPKTPNGPRRAALGGAKAARRVRRGKGATNIAVLGSVQVRVLTKDENEWPDEEPPPSVKTYNFQTVKGAKSLLDDCASEKGTVPLSTADAHWWVFDDSRKASKDMSTRGGRTCKVGLVFQDEVYVQITPPTARRVLAGFGIVFGSDHVVIYIKPRKPLDIRADTARSRIIINGTPAVHTLRHRHDRLSLSLLPSQLTTAELLTMLT